MGFKVDSDFLRFLTMGALATRRAMEIMEEHGLQPIELERYSCSNKIWGTKVKRLRLPDLISCNLGTRVEVRAKSKLAIKMSDSPENPARRWNSGLRREDLIAFVNAYQVNGRQAVAESVELFSVDALQRSEGNTNLGPPKSASQGAERDREWPSIVPSSDGEVERVAGEQLGIRRADGRAFSYNLRGRNAYVKVGQKFLAGRCFLAGAPGRKAEWPDPNSSNFDPRPMLKSAWELDRYAGAKILGSVGKPADQNALQEICANDGDARVRLEAACSLARLGVAQGIDALALALANPAEPYLRMEVVLMLGELSNSRLLDTARRMLVNIADNPLFADDEVRQAAIWCLGKSGLCQFDVLIPFLESPNENERMHAIVAFGNALPSAAIARLVEVLATPQASEVKIAGAALVLARQPATKHLISLLIPLARSDNSRTASWARMVLGQFPSETLERELNDLALLAALQPVSYFTARRNWTLVPEAATALHFLELQDL